MEKTICELFAGVGGFRVGMKRLNTDWKTVWFSQWEPGAKTQWAHDCYVKHFGDSPDIQGEFHTGEDIGLMKKENIPDHSLLVGGFPCFVGDTLIKTTQGLIKIKDITDKHKILFKGKEYKVLKQCFSGVKQIIELFFDDGYTCECTFNHKFLVMTEKGKEWIAANQLFSSNYNVLKEDNTTVKVIKEKIKKEMSVYDIEVETINCFCLETGIIAHNCQDYSVAHSLSSSKGIEGKKGVLWWQIRDILIAKNPPFCIFENVDRLLKSPAKQRGRDFGIILSCLDNLNYSVEWRVVNAANYGAAQKRKRTFIFAYKNDTNYGKIQEKINAEKILLTDGLMAKAFPVLSIGKINEKIMEKDTVSISDNFTFNFENAGYMQNGIIYTAKIIEKEESPILLKDILEHNVPEKYFIKDKEKIEKWKYQKSAKKIPRIAANGHEYIYSEGPVAFPDYLDKPARTILTSEGTLNRTSHIVSDLDTGELRILTPVEAERLQGFDDNWTNTGMSNHMRYFCMGNSLVVPMITRMGKILDEIIKEE